MYQKSRQAVMFLVVAGTGQDRVVAREFTWEVISACVERAISIVVMHHLSLYDEVSPGWRSSRRSRSTWEKCVKKALIPLFQVLLRRREVNLVCSWSQVVFAAIPEDIFWTSSAWSFWASPLSGPAREPEDFLTISAAWGSLK